MHCENVHLCLKSDDLQRRLNNSTVLNNPIDILFLVEQALRLDRKDFAFLKKKNEVDIVLALRSTNYKDPLLLPQQDCFHYSELQNVVVPVMYFPQFNNLEPSFLPKQVPGLDWEVSSFQNQRMSSPFLLLCILPLTWSHSFFPSKCPAFPPQQDFDWNAFAENTW